MLCGIILDPHIEARATNKARALATLTSLRRASASSSNSSWRKGGKRDEVDFFLKISQREGGVPKVWALAAHHASNKPDISYTSRYRTRCRIDASRLESRTKPRASWVWLVNVMFVVVSWQVAVVMSRLVRLPVRRPPKLKKKMKILRTSAEHLKCMF